MEWPERGAGVLPPVDLNVELAVAGEGRSVRLLGRSAVGNGWLERLSQQPQLQAFLPPHEKNERQVVDY